MSLSIADVVNTFFIPLLLILTKRSIIRLYFSTISENKIMTLLAEKNSIVDTADFPVPTQENPAVLADLTDRAPVSSQTSAFPVEHGELQDPERIARFADIRAKIEATVADGEVFTFTDVPTDSAMTISRAVEFYGQEAVQDLSFPQGFFPEVVEEVHALSRAAATLSEAAPKTTDTVHASVTPTQVLEAADTRSQSALPITDHTTEPSLRVMAKSLERMRARAGDIYEKKAADLALSQLVEDPARALVVVETVRPDEAKTVKHAGLFGSWALKRAAKRAVSIPRLAV
jgi:hypothetical protein